MYDIVIVGGGIHGAACAREAVDSGYRVMVLEQYDQVGQATSSKSSKLIHGGLRYLESGQFRLVRECLRERRFLLQNAHALVRLVPFHIPVYRFTLRPAWIIRLGLMIYYLFGGGRFRTVPPHQWSQLDGLKIDQLKTVFQYYDAQTDDRQLTEYVMSQAVKNGASLETRATFEAATLDDHGCTLWYRSNGQRREIRSRAIINATGPWANQILAHITPHQQPVAIDLVLGTHIVIDGRLDRGMYYLESPRDKRAIFVMSWKNRILVGTTETLFHGSPGHTEPPESDITYLIDVYNQYFERTISRQDVVDAFAGLRVLARDDGTIFHRSRDTLIHYDVHDPRIFTLYGGKLTSHRATARRMLKTVKRTLR